MGVCIIRDDPAEAARLNEALFARNGRARKWPNQLIGTPEQVADHLRPFVELGFRHIICGFPSPHDAESMERLVTEVRPMLEAS
jgi:alkanesulfonate monooxygenase SsuD/methylene tetrahydromethanopterin reductase-like flavin-dependent oxidoreductase (luciferase family)